MRTLLDAGEIPVEELATLAWREGMRPRPIYQCHKWFARRFGTAFRALLTAAALPEGADFWPTYYEGADWSGKSVLDPFVGGGTAVLEALRLGAKVVGIDVDPVACAITTFETRVAQVADPLPALERLQKSVGAALRRYYRTADGRDVVHFFWVQVVPCGDCGEEVEAHPHFQLAYEAEGTRQWAFCRTCHLPRELSRSDTEFTCDTCQANTVVLAGVVNFGRLTCPRCGTRERLIDAAARIGGPPGWRLFALEVLEEEPTGARPVPLARRSFRKATDADRDVMAQVEVALLARTDADGRIMHVPEDAIPVSGRSDDRLTRYGYHRYRDLFLPRQLLHLSLLSEAIAELPGGEREPLALALSDHLTTNCALTAYAFGWRRVSPLFNVRAFRHVPRPVELNPWLAGTGRGTFPNAVRQIRRAVEFSRAPQEPALDGGFRRTGETWSDWQERAAILHRDARSLADIPTGSVDLVLTDPPYFDNIAYSELADFYRPWLRKFGLVPPDADAPGALDRSLAARSRGQEAAVGYRDGLTLCFAEVARVLGSDGRLVFTYQHRTPEAWEALASALAVAGLRPLQVFPMLGDARGSGHARQGSTRWDAVFVVMKGSPAPAPGAVTISEAAISEANHHALGWGIRLSGVGLQPYGDADALNFQRASLVATALRVPLEGGREEPLLGLLRRVEGPPKPSKGDEGQRRPSRES